jgi:hypothetical protein
MVCTIDWNRRYGYWELHVSGKSGVCVNEQRYVDGSPPIRLKSKDIISTGSAIGDSFFQFLLPVDFRPLRLVKPKTATPQTPPLISNAHQLAENTAIMTPTPPTTPVNQGLPMFQ